MDLTTGITTEERPFFTSASTLVFRGTLQAIGSNRRVAVKCLKSRDPLDPKEDALRERMLRKEISVLMMARDPNVLPFLGHCRKLHQGTLLQGIVTPWAHGGTLRVYLQRFPETANRRGITEEIASGLDYLHTKNESKHVIVHGDLHPSNVLMSPEGHPQLADFGLSKILPDGRAPSISDNRTHYVAGVTSYIAPELHKVDSTPYLVPRSCCTDVFAFGALVFWIYAGRAPFEESPSSYGIMLRLCNRERPSRSQITRPDFATDLWSVITRCWAHNPVWRPTMHMVCCSLRDRTPMGMSPLQRMRGAVRALVFTLRLSRVARAG